MFANPDHFPPPESDPTAPHVDSLAAHTSLLRIVTARLAVKHDGALRRIRDRLEQTIELLTVG